MLRKTFITLTAIAALGVGSAAMARSGGGDGGVVVVAAAAWVVVLLAPMVSLEEAVDGAVAVQVEADLPPCTDLRP